MCHVSTPNLLRDPFQKYFYNIFDEKEKKIQMALRVKGGLTHDTADTDQPDLVSWVPLFKLPEKGRLSIHLSPCYACVRAPRRVRDRLRMPAGRAQPLHSQSPSTLPANPTQVA